MITGKAEYCDERVCLCVCVCACGVCLPAIISLELHVRSSLIFLDVAYGRGSVFLWRRSDMLCTSGFMDDVIFAHKPRLLDVAAQLKRSAHAALGLATNCVVIPVAGQRTHRATFWALKVTSQVATQGAESAVYN